MEWGLNMSNRVSLGPNHAPGTVRLLFRDIQPMGWTGDASTVSQVFLCWLHRYLIFQHMWWFWAVSKIIHVLEKWRAVGQYRHLLSNPSTVCPGRVVAPCLERDLDQGRRYLTCLNPIPFRDWIILETQISKIIRENHRSSERRLPGNLL